MRAWRWPTAIGALCASGLVAGLLSEGGAGDALAWIGLAVPIATAAVFCARKG